MNGDTPRHNADREDEQPVISQRDGQRAGHSKHRRDTASENGGNQSAFGVLEQLARASQLWLGLDFDGTLAPFVTDPADARPLPLAARSIDTLARLPGVRLALVTGRPAHSIVTLAPWPDGIDVIGSHGAEQGRWAGGQLTEITSPLNDPTVRSALAAVRTGAHAIAQQHAGVWVEEKPFAMVVHTRTADGTAAAAAEKEARALGESVQGAYAIAGKRVVELAVVDVSKGDAVVAEVTRHRPDAICYIGDDVTDETAFSALAGNSLAVTIKVGDGETKAQYRLSDPTAVAEWLSDVASLRGANLAEEQ